MAWKNVQYENGKYRTSEGGGGGGSSTFADLDDVDFSNLQNGQVPKYNSTTGKWENANESGGGGTVTDVEVDGVSVVNQQGVAEITMPTPPTIPVEDVEVNGESVVNAQKVAEIKSYKEVTQAEYNALPDSKLNDGILYAIEDSAGADSYPPLIYSDEEREVGVWRDGKPLYQKTVYCGDFTTSGNKSVAHNISNLDKVVMMYGAFNEGTTRFPLPIVMWGSAVTYQTRLAVDNTNIIISRDAAAQSVNIYVTLQYTKTTDTAGSGTWTTQGGYAHHYSTTEHVIGTWIDGKPIYERVFDLGADVVVDYSAFTNTSINASQMKAIIDAWGIYSTGVTKYSLMANISNNIIRLQTDRNGAAASVRYVILQYTKTSD